MKTWHLNRKEMAGLQTDLVRACKSGILTRDDMSKIERILQAAVLREMTAAENKKRAISKMAERMECE